MPKTLAAEPSLNPALLALKPRQVLILRPHMGKESKTSNLESEQKTLLLRSIAQYLEGCGFSKCFKKLLSESKIEKKELNSTLPDLEEIFSDFLKKRNQKAVEGKDDSSDDEDVNEKKNKKKEVALNAMEGVENVKKEKKKKKKETKVEVTEQEKVKETDAKIEDGLKEKKKKEKKASKKRKRSEPEENKEETEDDEESKRRKKEDDEGVQETPVKENGNVENSELKSANQKSGNGLSNSKEPKKPFQRVNVEDVVFTDNRLKDNSYWAKDGADSGYGAKAQEVLGQVRGRDFRHEKTKKKRGSYRGGEIDLQSHSVKFDYSDDE